MSDPVDPQPTSALIDSYTYSSPLPSKEVADIDKQGGEGWIMGIDEAGRGPVLGPMVYAAAFCPLSFKGTLEGLGFDDSKALSLSIRAHLFSLFSSHAQLCYMSSVLSPQDISRDMLRRVPFNLNRQAEEATIGLIRDTLARGVPLSEVYVDALGPAPQWQERLSKIFPTLTFDVRPKADSIFKIVGAASIIAKVTRDRLIEGWIHPEGSELPRRLIPRPVVVEKVKKEKNGKKNLNGAGGSKRKRGKAVVESDEEETGELGQDAETDGPASQSTDAPSSKRPKLQEFDSENLEDPTMAGVEALVAAVDGSEAVAGGSKTVQLQQDLVDVHPDLYEEMGSGYPSDPRTQEYLKKAFHPIFGFPSIARFSWAGVKIAMDKDGVGCKWIDDQSISDKMKFFDPGADNAKPKICKEIGLESVGEL